METEARVFHLSLPVTSFPDCLAFYQKCFGAEVVMLDERAADLFLFGAQLTLHDKPESALDDAARREMHFGHVVSESRWYEVRDRIRDAGFGTLGCVEPGESSSGRGKLLVVDPSGNIVEINSGLPPP
jgi:extradiol dioxygenase family protein